MMVRTIIFYSWFGLKECKRSITERTHQEQIEQEYPTLVKTETLGSSLELCFPDFAEATSQLSFLLRGLQAVLLGHLESKLDLQLCQCLVHKRQKSAPLAMFHI